MIERVGAQVDVDTRDTRAQVRDVGPERAILPSMEASADAGSGPIVRLRAESGIAGDIRRRGLANLTASQQDTFMVH
jgi:hypothetical protein